MGVHQEAVVVILVRLLQALRKPGPILPDSIELSAVAVLVEDAGDAVVVEQVLAVLELAEAGLEALHLSPASLPVLAVLGVELLPEKLEPVGLEPERLDGSLELGEDIGLLHVGKPLVLLLPIRAPVVGIDLATLLGLRIVGDAAAALRADEKTGKSGIPPPLPHLIGFDVLRLGRLPLDAREERLVVALIGLTAPIELPSVEDIPDDAMDPPWGAGASEVGDPVFGN